ncbi:hypothetical protein BSL78_20071 [Apostichopus japonicus]|uniref:Ig-like domain-containing protein n=1 Tax=Stichopus japonicus TaxID=307972 RepID=A0A2G8K545_STIJA|nr:hypothetical protein BSL78_20071 [Apostichopus japonicus]
MDGEYNEVVFVGETDITLRCSYNGNLIVDTVAIMDQNGNIVTEEINTILVEYRINTVAISDGGMYKCNVRSTYMDRTEVTEVATLDLNVKYDTSPQCFRNGTVGEPYKPGNLILLSCYCREMDMCLWSSNVIDSGQAVLLTPLDEMVIHKGKAIRRVILHYTSSTDPNTRYYCFSGSASTDRCAIGPESESSNDTIIESMETVTSTDVCLPPTSVPMLKEGIFSDSTTSKVTEIRDTTNRLNGQDSSELANGNLVLIVIVIGVSVVSLLMVFVVVLIVYRFCGKQNKSNRKVKDDKKTKDTTPNDKHETDYNTPYYNHTYQRTITDVFRDNNATYDDINDNSHAYDSPSMQMRDAVETSLPDDNYTQVDSPKQSQRHVVKIGSSRGRHDESKTVRSVESQPIPSENREPILDTNVDKEKLNMPYYTVNESEWDSSLPGKISVSTTEYAMVNKDN